MIPKQHWNHLENLNYKKIELMKALAPGKKWGEGNLPKF